jgi:hypothetical protein
MFRNKRKMTSVAVKEFTVAQLPLVFPLAAVFPEPEQSDVEHCQDQKKREKFCKTDTDHLPPPGFCQ